MAAAHIACAIETVVVFSTLALPAYAALPDEIQVYIGDTNASGESGLELHVNTTPSGIDMSSCPGEIMTSHGWRVTAEFSYGLTPSLELRLYVLIMLTCESTSHVTDPRVWAKWIPMHPVDDVGNFAGINVELAHVAGRSEAFRNAVELRLVYEYQNDRWLWAVSPVLDQNLSGNGYSDAPEATPGFKIIRTAATGVRAGTEHYAGPGSIDHIAPLHERQHMAFLVFDVDRKPFVFNLGVGRGLTHASDRWTPK